MEDAVMLRIICPKGGEDAIREIVNIHPKRRYEILCKRCGATFIADGNELAPGEEPKPLNPTK